MTRSCGGITGGWTRVAYLDFMTGFNSCPTGLSLRHDINVPSCGTNPIIDTSRSCVSSFVDTLNLPYDKVCGRVLGYQVGSTDAFGDSSGSNIDTNFVDGIVLTHGRTPRKHIWTFTAARDEHGQDEPTSICPCSNIKGKTQVFPEFIGQNVFCDSGVSGRYSEEPPPLPGYNPLWDGYGCSQSSICCGLNKPPWFYAQLTPHDQPVTDDIEMRMCSNDESDAGEGVRLSLLELYIQ